MTEFDVVRAGIAGGVTAEELFSVETECFSDPWSARSFEAALEAPYGVFYALIPRGGGRIAGCAGMYCVADEGQITNVGVLPEYRRRGGAGALLSALTSEALSRGLAKLTLEVRESNAAARQLYEKHGFYPVGRRKNYYAHPAEDAVLMDKDLKKLC